MDIIGLPPELITLASAGNAAIRLAMSPDGRLAAMIHLTTPSGQQYAIGLQPRDCVTLRDDLDTLCDATPEQFETWRLELGYAV